MVNVVLTLTHVNHACTAPGQTPKRLVVRTRANRALGVCWIWTVEDPADTSWRQHADQHKTSVICWRKSVSVCFGFGPPIEQNALWQGRSFIFHTPEYFCHKASPLFSTQLNTPVTRPALYLTHNWILLCNSYPSCRAAHKLHVPWLATFLPAYVGLLVALS